MYKLVFNFVTKKIECVNKTEGKFLISIPFDPDNTDYANFKKDVLEGAELQDADGNVMSAKAAQAFIKELP